MTTLMESRSARKSKIQNGVNTNNDLNWSVMSFDF